MILGVRDAAAKDAAAKMANPDLDLDLSAQNTVNQNLEFQAPPNLFAGRGSQGEEDDGLAGPVGVAPASQVDAVNAALDGIGPGPAGTGPAGTGPSGDGPSGATGDGPYQHGGTVHGPAGIDKVPGRLTAGEFVVDKDSAQKFRGLLGLLNRWEPR
jgi:hypothetical protein